MRCCRSRARTRSCPLLVEQYLGKVATIEAHTFTALNTAFLDDGAVVHVAKEVEVARPIHLLFVTDASAAQGARSRAT